MVRYCQTSCMCSIGALGFHRRRDSVASLVYCAKIELCYASNFVEFSSCNVMWAKTNFLVQLIHLYFWLALGSPARHCMHRDPMAPHSKCVRIGVQSRRLATILTPVARAFVVIASLVPSLDGIINWLVHICNTANFLPRFALSSICGLKNVELAIGLHRKHCRTSPTGPCDCSERSGRVNNLEISYLRSFKLGMQ